jgi:hypothetical protein
MTEWRSSDTEPPDRTKVLLIRKTKVSVPLRARYFDLGAWIEIRPDGSKGGLINAPFEWKFEDDE